MSLCLKNFGISFYGSLKGRLQTASGRLRCSDYSDSRAFSTSQQFVHLLISPVPKTKLESFWFISLFDELCFSCGMDAK